MLFWRSFLVATFWFMPSVSGCSVTEEWHRWSFKELLHGFDIVVVGRDLRHVNNSITSVPQDSEFRVSCVLKGDGRGVLEQITIFGVYPLHTCHHMDDEMRPGNDYIVGLRREGNGYRLHLVNVLQPSVYQNTTFNLQTAHTVCGFQNPRLPNGRGHMTPNYPFCSAPKVPDPCLITSGQGQSLPSRGTLLPALLSVIVVLRDFLITVN